MYALLLDFANLFSFLSSFLSGKSRLLFLEKREERGDKREEYKKKKAADATFSFWWAGMDSNHRSR